MLFTLACIAVILISIMAVGIPVRWMLGTGASLDELGWLQAPFLGIAVIVLALQNLVYLDLPLSQSIPFFWAAILLLWLLFLRKGAVRQSIRALPWRPFLLVLFVYAVQGLGLLRVGARNYVGRAWVDQFNYTSVTQFLIDKPYSTPLSAIANQPYLVQAITKKTDRIGQSVLHGFFAVNSFGDAKKLFEPTILLSPALIALAIYILIITVGGKKGVALLAGAAAGLLPAITMVHLESFQSQALVMPFLALFLVVVQDLMVAPSWERLAVAALIYAVSVNIYTEFWVILTAIIILDFLICVYRGSRFSHLAGYSILLLVAPVALTPLFAAGILRVNQRIGLPVLQSLYPWAFQIEGVNRLWLGDLVELIASKPFSAIRIYGVALTVCAYSGLVWFFASQLVALLYNHKTSQSRTKMVISANLLALTSMPVLLFIGSRDNPYQFYKLLLSVSPFYVVGITILYDGLALSALGTKLGCEWKRLSNGFAISILGIIIVVGMVSTIFSVLQSSYAQARPRQNQYLLLNAGMRELEPVLEQLHDRNLLLTSSSGYINAWLSYFARNNRIWLGSAIITDIDISQIVELTNSVDLGQMPSDIIVVTDTGKDKSRIPSDSEIIWSGTEYMLWRPKANDWAAILGINNKNALETMDGESFFWMSAEDTRLRVFSKKTGILRLDAVFFPGPSLQGSNERHVLVRSKGDYEKEILIKAEKQTIAIPVQMGVNEIVLRVLDKPNVINLPNGDPRTLLMGVRGLAVSLGDNLATIERIENPYGLEQTNEPFFWLGTQPTRIFVNAAQSGRLSLKAHFVMGPSVASLDRRTVLVENDGGYREIIALSAGDQTIAIPVHPGSNVVKLTSLDRPVLGPLPNGDTRVLVLGITRLTAVLDPSILTTKTK